jgi:mycothiol synthase
MQPPRPYRNEQDLQQMLDLLVEGRRAANGSYYVHIGDLKWWLYYPAEAFEWPEAIFLWDQPGEELLGWVFFSLKYRSFDLFIRPDLRGSRRHAAMLGWAEGHLASLARSLGGQEMRTMWVLADDQVMARLLAGRGFARAEDFMNHLIRSMDEPLPALLLPEGFSMQAVAGEQEAERRAAASYAAFASSWSFEAYCRRYLDFMRSPAYDPQHDLVVTAPDGRIASFCIIWTEPVNRVGLFEPVGTHPDFQRMGLGKAVMAEGLRRFKEEGMRSAIVGAEHDKPAALGLYQALGFRRSNRICTYAKSIR